MVFDGSMSLKSKAVLFRLLMFSVSILLIPAEDSQNIFLIEIVNGLSSLKE
jgi:hypothetical protein